MKKGKVLKGMTLIEVLIAVAIMGIMTLFLAKNASVIERYNASTTRLNKKIAYEAPLAETAQSSDYDAALIDDSVTIRVGYDSENLDKYTEIKGKAYTTEEDAHDYLDDNVTVAGSGLHLKFITLD